MFVWQDDAGAWRDEHEVAPGPDGRYAWAGHPWALRCDTCQRLLPYGCVLREREARTSPDQAREVLTRDEHGRLRWTTGGWPLICGVCEDAAADERRGYRQLDLWAS
jgi:hypothetical protein